MSDQSLYTPKYVTSVWSSEARKVTSAVSLGKWARRTTMLMDLTLLLTFPVIFVAHIVLSIVSLKC